jgi:hypothetical protein
MWFLARAKLKYAHKYYGAYLGGFPERARVLLGADINDCVLHVCGGKSKHYPYRGGFGPNDMTMDLDSTLYPDILHDARLPWPVSLLKHVLIDPPYSEDDAKHYAPGASAYPSPNLLLKRADEALQIGGRVGIIHYILPKAPKSMRFVACTGILCGFNNRIRVFSVWEKQQ